MPMRLLVHSAVCTIREGTCNCQPQEFSDARAAVAAHGGQSWRLQIAGVTVPEGEAWVPFTLGPVPAHRSQAARHKRPISD